MRNASVLGAWLVVCVGADVFVFGADPFNVPLRINMGGAETVDSLGRTWLGDGPGNGDPLGIRPEDAGGANFAEYWVPGAILNATSFADLGYDSIHPGDAYIFSTIRWDDGVLPPNYILEIPLPAGDYTVNLYLDEGCCSFRHFKIELQGEIVDDDVSAVDYDPGDLSLPDHLGVLAKLSFDVTVGDDKLLRVALLPCLECPGATDTNAILNALEVVSAPGCDNQGLDFSCSFDPATGEVTGTWKPVPSADGYRILKNGVPLGGDLPGTESSFTDVSPGSGGSPAVYVLEALDGGVAFQECRSTVSVVLCPRSLVCTPDPVGGEVALSWEAPVGLNVTSYEVRRNGTLIDTLPGSDTTYEDVPTGRYNAYAVTPVTSPAGACAAMECSAVVEGLPFEPPVRFNMGGRTTVDSLGRTWLGDGPGAGDPLGIRVDDLGGTNTIESWCPLDASSLERLGLDPANPSDTYIFSTIRWDNGGDASDYRLEIPVPPGDGYVISLYFAECCCPGRHFKLELQGEILDPDVSYVDYAETPTLGAIGRLTFTGVSADDGLIRVALLPCPECAGATDINAILEAIEIVQDPCSDPSFKQCPGSLTCSIDTGTKQVTGTWEPPVCLAVQRYDVLRDGQIVTNLPGSATSFTDTLPSRVGYYEVRAVLAAGLPSCAPMKCAVVNPTVAFSVPLRINMGGPFAVDSKGQSWIGDQPGTGDVLDIRVDDLGGTNTILNWCLLQAASNPDSLEALGYDPVHPGDQAIFNSIRYDTGDDVVPPALPGDRSDDIDFRLAIPVPNGTYDLNFYTTECCCPNRHIQIELQGVVEAQDVSMGALGNRMGRTASVTFEDVVVTDGILSLGILPCFDCPPEPFPAVDTNPTVSAIELLPAGGTFKACARNLSCVPSPDLLEVIGTWSGPENVAVTGYELYRNGELLDTLPAGATEFVDEVPCVGMSVYEVKVVSSDPACQDIVMRCTYRQPGCPYVAPLRINMGGIEALDSRGNMWLGDGPGAGDPLEIRLDDLGGDQTGENWSLGAFVPESLAALGFDPAHPSDVYIFNTIRWDLGATPPNFLMEIPMEDGTYTVNVYFNEGFPSERHFQLTVQDALVDDDVSWRDSDPVSPLRGKVWVVTTEDVVVDDGILRIGLLPCPTCPGVTDMNPIVDAIEVLGTGGPVAPRFHRADSNADGIVNITDGIFVLNYLFLGGPAPSCIEAANANDDAVLNITDGIFILNYLFLGGPGPAPPGPVGQPCGSDPPGSPSDLGCIQYNNC